MIPEEITTKYIPTQYELAIKSMRHFREATCFASDSDILDIYEAIISGDALALGKLLLKIDNELTRSENDE